MKKNLWDLLPITLVVSALLVGCAKPPQVEIDAAKAAVDQAKTEGADIYAKTEMIKAQEAFKEGMAEVNKQKGMFFADYTQSKKLLKGAMALADAAKSKAGLGRVKARAEAEEALARAESVIKEVKKLIAKKPKNKKKRTKFKALKKELAMASTAAASVKKTIDAGDYIRARGDAVMALTTAEEIKNKIAPKAKKVKMVKKAKKVTKKKKRALRKKRS